MPVTINTSQNSINNIQFPRETRTLLSNAKYSVPAKTSAEKLINMREKLYRESPHFDRTASGGERTQATAYIPKQKSFWNPTTDYSLEQFHDYISDHVAKGNAHIIGIENLIQFKERNPEKPVIFSYVTHSMQTVEVATFSLLVAQASGKKAAVAVAKAMTYVHGPEVCKELNIISTDEIETRIRQGEDVIVLSDGFEGANSSNICKETVGTGNGQGNVRADILTSRTGLARIAVRTGAAMSVVYSTGADHAVAVQPRGYSDFLASTFKLPAFAIDPRSLVGGPTNKQHAPLTFFCDEIKCPPQDKKPDLHGLASLQMHRIKEVISPELKTQLEGKTLDQWTLEEVNQVIAETQAHLKQLQKGTGTAEELENQQLKPLDKNGLNLLRTIQSIASQSKITAETTVGQSYLFPTPDGYKSFEKDIQNLIGNEFSQYAVYDADVLGTAGNRGECNFTKARKATEQLLRDTSNFKKFFDGTLKKDDAKRKEKFSKTDVKKIKGLTEEIKRLECSLGMTDLQLEKDRQELITQAAQLTTQTSQEWLTDLTHLLTGKHESFDLEKHLEKKPTSFSADGLKNIKIHIANLKQREQLVAAIDVRVHELEILFADHYATAYDAMPVPIKPEDRRFISAVDTSRTSKSSIKTPLLKFGFVSPLASLLPTSLFRASAKTTLQPLAPSSFTRLTEQAHLAEKQLALLAEWETFEQDIRGSWMPTAGEIGVGTAIGAIVGGIPGAALACATEGFAAVMQAGAQQRINKDFSFMRK